MNHIDVARISKENTLATDHLRELVELGLVSNEDFQNVLSIMLKAFKCLLDQAEKEKS